MHFEFNSYHNLKIALIELRWFISFFVFQWNINGNPKNMIRRKKVQVEMLVGIASFYLVWIPYIICAIIIILGGRVKHEVLIAATICTKFGVIINPVVFVFRNRDVSRYQTLIISYDFLRFFKLISSLVSTLYFFFRSCAEIWSSRYLRKQKAFNAIALMLVPSSWFALLAISI